MTTLEPIDFIRLEAHLPARMFSTALATMKFLSETRPWIGFSSRFGTAYFGAVALVILATKAYKKYWVRRLLDGFYYFMRVLI